MTQLSYLPKGYKGGLTEAQQKIVQIVFEVQNNLYKKRAPVFKDRDLFCHRLFELAEKYKYLQRKHSEVNDARSRFSRLSTIVQKLDDLLSEVSSEALSALDKQMTLQWENSSTSEKEDIIEKYCTTYWPPLALPISILNDGLNGLKKASIKLSRVSILGRAKLHVDHWAAREFVWICHSMGWSPVRMANSGSESKHINNTKLPDAVRCLAAVFELAGSKNPCPESRAMTVLRALRSPAQHPIVEVYGPEGEYYDIEWFEISLQKSTSELWKDIPNFIPNDCR